MTHKCIEKGCPRVISQPLARQKMYRHLLLSHGYSESSARLYSYQLPASAEERASEEEE